jgi:hypothetical protein
LESVVLVLVAPEVHEVSSSVSDEVDRFSGELFHDARHASLTNGAANGENPIALMTRAGHKSMATTKRYLP